MPSPEQYRGTEPDPVAKPTAELSTEDREPPTRKLREAKLSLILALTLGLSACAEKAKSWSSEQLQKFKERPNAEKVEKSEVDRVVNAIHNFAELGKQGGQTKNLDIRDPKLVEQYANEPHGSWYYNDATLIDNDSVLVEEYYPEDYMVENAGRKFHDTVYRVVNDPKTGRFLLVIQYGNALPVKEGEKNTFGEIGIDEETGVLLYKDYNIPLSPALFLDDDGKVHRDEAFSFQLEDEGGGDLGVKKGYQYDAGSAQYRVENLLKGQVSRLESKLRDQLKR
jgi:hypothetical protein